MHGADVYHEFAALGGGRVDRQAGARHPHSTIQNWSHNTHNLVTKRGVAHENATIEWVDAGNLGSKLTMKYPAVYLVGEGARGEILSVAYAGDGQHQDAGGKVVHAAPNTSSLITSKSISKGTGRSTYRGLLKVHEGCHDSKRRVECDALLLDENARTDTYPYIEIEEKKVNTEHEATVSKVGEDQLFYLMSRGLSEEEAIAMVVNGFIEPSQGASAGVRHRAEPPDPTGDGRLGRLESRRSYRSKRTGLVGASLGLARFATRKGDK